MKTQLCALTLAFAVAFSLKGETNWTPKRIVSFEYPLLGVQSRSVGVVKVECSLSPEGAVLKARVVEGPSVLGQAVLARIGDWTFTRTGIDDAHLNVTIVVDFQLEGTATANPKSKFVYEYPDKFLVISAPILRSH